MTTSRSNRFRRGDVVYVPFHFVDKDARIVRPAVIVSSSAYHESRNDVVIVGITSNIQRSGFVGQFEVNDLASAGLEVRSAVTGVVMTVRTNQIARQIGSFATTDLAALRSSIEAIFRE